MDSVLGYASQDYFHHHRNSEGEYRSTRFLLLVYLFVLLIVLIYLLRKCCCLFCRFLEHEIYFLFFLLNYLFCIVCFSISTNLKVAYSFNILLRVSTIYITFRYLSFHIYKIEKNSCTHLHRIVRTEFILKAFKILPRCRVHLE